MHASCHSVHYYIHLPSPKCASPGIPVFFNKGQDNPVYCLLHYCSPRGTRKPQPNIRAPVPSILQIHPHATLIFTPCFDSFDAPRPDI
jgi:hypothetical protein